MEPQPLVSIIIPTYNRAHLIGETLDSVLAQTYQNWECIIVDDGSTDNTDEVVGKYVQKDKRFKYFHRPDEHLPGGNGARNYGFKMSQGEYVNWFDSDDLMLPEKIEFQVQNILNTDYDFIVCEGAEVDSKSNIIKKWNNINSKDPFADHISGKLVLSTNGPLFRKSILENKPGFNEKLKKKQEWEYFTRILLNNNYYIPLSKTLYYVRTKNKQIHISNFIRSKNEANNLIYRLVKRKKPNLFNHKFKRNFLHKYIINLKISYNSGNLKDIFFSLYYALGIINYKYVISYIKLKNEKR